MLEEVFKKIRKIHLEAECADRRVQSFIKDYSDITGISLRPRTDFQVQSSHNDNKRGLEGRIYFNATDAQVQAIRKLGIRVQGPRNRGYLSNKYSYRIDRNDVFWMLVRAGHRL
jgi:hypothetical protein